MHPHPAMNFPPGHSKLLKFLYGLKQSPHNWNTHLHNFIIFIVLRLSQLDHCMYISVIDSHTVILAVFVGDIFPASKFLNIRITQRPGAIKGNLCCLCLQIGTRNYADVPSMTEYILLDATPTSPKQLEYVSAYPYASRLSVFPCCGITPQHLMYCW